ncbi:MAG: hypothetical protein B7Z75_13380 [Acidocella sp. 20-57-95]|nr:MAG: hypothetical protein B7Z75_13380 [Acidocella sp. 20-57-95]OYV61849.1 MAG: hypothetical protein B7Z71_03615 [Acidocella sp. 21-58-7]
MSADIPAIGFGPPEERVAVQGDVGKFARIRNTPEIADTIKTGCDPAISMIDGRLGARRPTSHIVGHSLSDRGQTKGHEN